MVNYLQGDWQFFAGELPIIERPPPIVIKKSDLLRDLGPAITNSVEALKLILGELGAIN